MAENLDDFSRLIADLQQQRRILEKNLDETNRSSRSTQELVDKIIELKERSLEVAEGARPIKPVDR